MRSYTTGLTRTWVIREPNPTGEGLYERQGAMVQADDTENPTSLYIGACGVHGGTHFVREEVQELMQALGEFLLMTGVSAVGSSGDNEHPFSPNPTDLQFCNTCGLLLVDHGTGD